MSGEARQFDHVVVGAGIMGSSTAYRLAQRGNGVALLEQFELGHNRGSSHGHARIFRLAYDDQVYVQLAQRARAGWLALQAEAGIELLEPGGVMDVGPPTELDPIEAALKASRAETSRGQDVTGAGEVLLPEGFEILYQRDGGTSWAGRARSAFVNLARQSGVEIHERTPVQAIIGSGDSASISTPAGTFQAKTVVVTAGGWSNPLLRPSDISVPIRVTREHVAYYRKRRPEPFVPFIWHPGDGSPQSYGLPNLADETVKIGRHIAGAAIDPDSEGDVDPNQIALIDEFVAARLPGLDPHPVRSETCLYANSPDDDFVLDRVGPVVIGAGFGGHGFKFAPVIGELLADLAEDKRPEIDPKFSLRRFSCAHA